MWSSSNTSTDKQADSGLEREERKEANGCLLVTCDIALFNCGQKNQWHVSDKYVQTDTHNDFY